MSDGLNAPACPSPDVLGAFIEGRLHAAERQSVQQHLGSCFECAYAVGGTVRLRNADEEEAGETEDETPKRRVPAAAIAAALAALMLLVVVWKALTGRDPMRRLQRAVAASSTRSVEGRVAAFPHVRFGAPRAETPPADAAVRIEAERILRLTGEDTPAAHARGVAALVLGHEGEAIALLERATHLKPQHAAYWSDLSAALSSGRPDEKRSRAALDAADRAIAIDPTLAAAHFNRGLALERLGLAERAAEAYGRSSALEGDSGWAAEARRRQESLAR